MAVLQDPTTLTLAVAALVFVLGVLVGSRRRRTRALEPVQLGPRWNPPGVQRLPRVARGDDDRVDLLCEQTGLDAPVVATVLTGWEEHLAVIGILALPEDHVYRVYDPYSPPIPKRHADGWPLADPARVVRDVAIRTNVSEFDAWTVLEALLGAPPSDHPGDRPRGRAPSRVVLAGDRGAALGRRGPRPSGRLSSRRSR